MSTDAIPVVGNAVRPSVASKTAPIFETIKNADYRRHFQMDFFYFGLKFQFEIKIACRICFGDVIPHYGFTAPIQQL